MANSAPGGTDDFNSKIIGEYGANEGRVSGPLAGTPMILIHHIGAEPTAMMPHDGHARCPSPVHLTG
jgi:hypothetical protein